MQHKNGLKVRTYILGEELPKKCISHAFFREIPSIVGLKIEKIPDQKTREMEFFLQIF